MEGRCVFVFFVLNNSYTVKPKNKNQMIQPHRQDKKLNQDNTVHLATVLMINQVSQKLRLLVNFKQYPNLMQLHNVPPGISATR
jgi:hypothetical protein